MKITEYFSQLVQIDSPSGAEHEMAVFLIEWLDKLGFTVVQDSVGNVFASINVFKGCSATLLLCGHMDTVQPGIGIVPVLEKGIYKSKGNTILGADNKASIAAIMVAVETFFSDSKNAKKPLEIIFTVKEETGGGIDVFDFKLPTAKTILICDYAQPIGTVVLGSPFIQNFTVKFTGKSAHSSRRDLGINAFAGLADFLQEVEVGLFDDGLTLVNIGKVTGGTGVNTIPGNCKIYGEVRSFKKDLFQKKIGIVESIAQKIAKEKGLQVSFLTDGFCPGYLYEECDEHIQKAAVIVETITGNKAKFKKTFGVSDANITVSAGFDTIVISDGVKDPHTTKESVAVTDLVLLSKVVGEFIECKCES